MKQLLALDFGFIEEEIANLVQEMMQGKTKPSQLVKIGGALFRRISAGLGTELHSVDGTAGAAKQAEGLLANEGVVFLALLVSVAL